MEIKGDQSQTAGRQKTVCGWIDQIGHCQEIGFDPRARGPIFERMKLSDKLKKRLVLELGEPIVSVRAVCRGKWQLLSSNGIPRWEARTKSGVLYWSDDSMFAALRFPRLMKVQDGAETFQILGVCRLK
jgi:hypothetical protein